jgi:hypothetical protein
LTADSADEQKKVSTMKNLSICAALVVSGVMVIGCPKKVEPVAVVDAAPAPVPTPVETALPDVAPIVEDAGPDTGADAGKKLGPASNTAQIRACCNALAGEAKRLGPGSIEGGMLMGVVGQCNQVANSSASGNSVELSALKAAMRGRSVPPVCRSF